MTKRKLIAFDLDGTLAVTKSAISDAMAKLVVELLGGYQVCVISGGNFDQFVVQVIDRLEVSPQLLARLHIMPTSGTKYLRFDPVEEVWVTQYSEDLTAEIRAEIIDALATEAKELGFWELKPDGDIIEDRGSQITFSALGQEAPAAKKYAWDPSGAKKRALRNAVAMRLPELEVHSGGTTSVDVTRAGIDKAYGMRKLMHELNLVSDDILFFGDKLEAGGNDYPVKAMGIDTIAVRDSYDTGLAIAAILGVS